MHEQHDVAGEVRTTKRLLGEALADIEVRELPLDGWRCGLEANVMVNRQGLPGRATQRRNDARHERGGHGQRQALRMNHRDMTLSWKFVRDERLARLLGRACGDHRQGNEGAALRPA